MNKIIFVEGISGVSKTTTTTFLFDKLQGMGYKVSSYLEGANDNPLDPFGGTYPPVISLIEFTETYLQYWRKFMEAKFDNEFMILDGTLLHHQINDMLREYRAANEVIINHLSSLLHVILPFNPIIFYLSSSDVAQRLIQARKSRMQTAPTEDRIRFWVNRKRVDLYVLERLPVKSQIHDVDNGWDSILDIMVGCITA